MVKNVPFKFLYIVLVVGITLLTACSQDEGFGGNSEIKGELMERVYNEDRSVLLSETPAKAEDIYIMFGNNTVVDDKVETSYTGDFKFSYLWPGEYTIFYLSDDTSDNSKPKMEIMKQVTLGKNESLDLGSLYTYKIKDWDQGSSAINGVLIERIYNDDLSILLSESPAKAQDIFIMLGDNTSFNDKVETSYNGQFEFNNIWGGDYTIYYMSDDTADISQPDVEIKQTLSLSNNTTVQLDTMYTYKIKEWNEGSATIRGKVMVTNYKNSSTYPNLVIKDITPAQEQEIYITYGNHTFYDDRIRTQDDGTFEFRNLIKGTYRIFVYSEDVTGGTANIVKEVFATITEDGQYVELSNISIEKL
ncbi:hypothetical protein ACE1ET_01425 [Saccharicrinis sp. FJH62]|uniref:hypothetical protein n=1 Tax=Saccharicrinis sp. FJH62 TaxID=3344657 RepID=UPI0035D49820